MIPRYVLSIFLNTKHYCINNLWCSWLTHSFLHFEAQQFLVVFIKCGGSEKKKTLPSSAYGLCVLYTSFLSLWCNLTSRRLIDAPSKVTPITYMKYTQNHAPYVISFWKIYTLNPDLSRRNTASQNGSYKRSPVIWWHGKCAYGNWRSEKRPLTMKDIMVVASDCDPPVTDCSNLVRWELMSPKSV